MSRELIIAFISLLGVLLSALVSFLVSKRAILAESRRLHLESKKLYETKLLEMRLSVYPGLYMLLSSLIKDLEHHRTDRARLEVFLDQVSDWDTKHSLFFSKNTGHVCYLFRRDIEKLLNSNDEDLENKLSAPDFIKDLSRSIEKVEVALKSDLGIYGLEISGQEFNVKVRERYGSPQDKS